MSQNIFSHQDCLHSSLSLNFPDKIICGKTGKIVDVECEICGDFIQKINYIIPAEKLPFSYIDDNKEYLLYFSTLCKKFFKLTPNKDFFTYNSVDEYLGKSKFDEKILFIDIVMPHKDGYVLVENILDKYNPMPSMFFLTACLISDHGRKFMKEYNINHMPKPINQSYLYEGIINQ